MATTPHAVRVIGPRELAAASKTGEALVWTVSKAPEDWQRELSPFYLGPVPLYNGNTAVCMENAWQYAKVYADHVDAAGEPSEAYWAWANDGWRRPAVRYPKGKGAKPLYSLWAGEKLGYLDARKHIYWPLYRDSVKQTAGYQRLKELHAVGPVTLFDFDGYEAPAAWSLRDVANHPGRPMGHAFVLKAMLLYGDAVEPSDLPLTPTEPQFGLF